MVLTRAKGFLGDSDGKESACNVGDPSSIPGSGRSPGKGNGNLLQYSCLENSKDRRAWKATLHGVAKSWTGLSNYHFHSTWAEWHNQPAPWQLTVTMTTTRKAQTRAEKDSCIHSGSKPCPCSWITHDYSCHPRKALHFTSAFLYMWCLSLNQVEKLIFELNSEARAGFSMLWPVN